MQTPECEKSHIQLKGLYVAGGFSPELDTNYKHECCRVIATMNIYQQVCNITVHIGVSIAAFGREIPVLSPGLAFPPFFWTKCPALKKIMIYAISSVSSDFTFSRTYVHHERERQIQMTTHKNNS